MRKSKRSARHQILLKLLEHLKVRYDFELTPDAVRSVLCSNAGVDVLLSFKSDSHLDELKAALYRLDKDTFGTCIACKRPIAQRDLDEDITMRVCRSCEAEFTHRRKEVNVPLSSPRER